MAPFDPSSLARLRQALGAVRDGASEDALFDAHIVVGTILASLDAERHPEVAKHVSALCERCVEALRAAARGEASALDEALALVERIGPLTPRAPSRAWPEAA